MTPVFCCGFECGAGLVSGSAHFQTLPATMSISTTTVRSGLRSLRVNTSANTGSASVTVGTSANKKVFRFYVYFTTLPSADVALFRANITNEPGVYFKQSDSKIYPGSGGATPVFGSTGISVITGQWYLIDVYIDSSSTTWTVDVKVDGTAATQYTLAGVNTTIASALFGSSGNSTQDTFYDDFIVSNTTADYPIGDGKIIGYVPNADGTHTSTSTNITKGTIATPVGTAIIAGTTDAFNWVNARPIGGGATDNTRLINQQTNSTTQYVEVAFEDSVESAAPRAVEALSADRQASTATGDLTVKLNDNGTENTIIARVTTAGTTTDKYATKQYATAPTGGAWVLGGGGAGDFNNIKARFGYSNDANPDQYWRGIMLEAEYLTTPTNSLVTYYGSSKNTGVAGTPTYNYSGTVVAGDLMVWVIASKYGGTALGSIPSGYSVVGTASSTTAGTGADVGSVRITILTKIADGTETGTGIQINNPTSTGILGTLWQFRKADILDTWDTPVFTSVAQNAGAASLSFTSPSTLALSEKDAFLGVIGLNTDLYTYSSLSLTTPGLFTNVADAAASRVTAGGDDLAIIEALYHIIGGVPTTAPVFTATASGSTANNPAGEAVFIKISATKYVPVATSSYRLMLMGVG